MSVINSYMMNGKGNFMDKVRRVERMVAMTKLLVDSPQKLIPLNYFCDFFGMAKSTVSEDLTCVRQSMEHFQLGTLETVAGVAGGVRFIPHRKGAQANDILRDVQTRLMEPDRIIPGGFIYMSDILYDWHVMTRLGEIIMTRFMDSNPDYILTVETKGIPLAVMAALAAVGRVAFAPVPFFKPTSAIIIITASVFGPEAGFLTGTMAALASNLFFGQGPWTPWQMFSWGMIGFLSGFLIKKNIINNKTKLYIFGSLTGFIYGWIIV